MYDRSRRVHSPAICSTASLYTTRNIERQICTSSGVPESFPTKKPADVGKYFLGDLSKDVSEIQRRSTHGGTMRGAITIIPIFSVDEMTEVELITHLMDS